MRKPATLSHDLDDYMHEVTAKMQSEYERIRKNARNDPGTAGNEGEENWAELLRGWLPPTYHIVTKGQILGIDGSLSNQLDVIILHPYYPRHLEHKKKYLEAGVVAAFECKLTLRKKHIYDAVQTAARLRRMVPTRRGTPYKELYSPPIYGVLAHAHAWKEPPVACAETITKHLADADQLFVKHPREMLDFVCIPGLATWTVTKDVVTDPREHIDWSPGDSCALGPPETTYFYHSGFLSSQTPEFTPIGIFIAQLLVKLAWEDEQLRSLADYFTEVESSTSADGVCRGWLTKIFSPGVRKKIRTKRMPYFELWNEWCRNFD